MKKVLVGLLVSCLLFSGGMLWASPKPDLREQAEDITKAGIVGDRKSVV